MLRAPPPIKKHWLRINLGDWAATARSESGVGREPLLVGEKMRASARSEVEWIEGEFDSKGGSSSAWTCQ